MDAIAKQLGACLSAELAALGELECALQDEHSALVENDLERLEGATARKRAAVEAQVAAQAQRTERLAQANMPADVKLSELVRWLRRDTDDPDRLSSADLCEQLLQSATACNDLNRRNGGLILRQQDRTRQVLDILRGVEGDPQLYSPVGGVDNARDTRTLGKA